MTPLDTRFLNATKNLLREIPISPPDGSAAIATGTSTQSFTKLKFVDAEDRIAFVKLTPVTAGNKKGALSFSAKYASDVVGLARADYVPIWWLPWSAGHMTKLKIDAMATVPQDRGNNALPNPSVFVTAALSGCSVFVTGVPTAPKVYHGGLEDSLSHFFGSRGDVLTTFAPNQTAEEFWETVLNGVDNFAGAKPLRDSLYDGNNQSMSVKVHPMGHVDKTARASTKSVNKSHYVNTAGSGTTPAATAYQLFLQNQNQREFQIQSVAPWGSVFGIRDGITGNWKFYLQENATVSYVAFRKSTFLGWETGGNEAIDLRIDRTTVQSRVIRLTRFYPGQGNAKTSTASAVLTR